MLEGARNFRAVAPYPAAGGRRLKPGVVYRSGELSRLGPEDLDILQDLKIRLVCDLRSRTEQQEYVSRWPDGSVHRHLELADRDQSAASPEKLFAIVASQPGELGALKAMDLLYRRKPQAYAEQLKTLFAEILAGDALPLLVHCHAGKDRTGFIVAMLLAAAGVARADIFADYEMTAQFFPEETEARAIVAWARRSYGQEITAAAARPMVQARPGYLAASFEEIDRGWGGVGPYLRDAVGLQEPALERLRELLLTEV
jgi:protein-tyrosine phosphatase